LDIVRLGAWVLDRLLDDLLHLVPVVGVHSVNVASEVFLDLAEHIPLIPVRDEGDGDSNATETARSADAVQVSLIVGFAGLGAGGECLGDILKGVSLVFKSLENRHT
jgi:hypothetical protein